MKAPTTQRDFLRCAAEMGWTAEGTPGKHVRLRHRDGALVFVARTPSDVRSFRNNMATLRRAVQQAPRYG